MNFKIKRSAQAGFTLIELIVVIVILGILAATALPKFANLSGDARKASLSAGRGAMGAAAAMAHGKYLAATTPPTSIVVEGVTVSFATTVANTGYPKADANFLLAAGLSNTDYTTVLNGDTGAGKTAPTVSPTSIAVVPNSVAGTATALKCYVMYTEPTAPNLPPTIVAGTSLSSECE